eukprot:1211657-Pleurochrysis_carterae.AAC.2
MLKEERHGAQGNRRTKFFVGGRKASSAGNELDVRRKCAREKKRPTEWAKGGAEKAVGRAGAEM